MSTDTHLFPLSNIQKGILQSELLHPGLLTNNICTSLTYNENLNTAYLNKAFRYIIENNEVLRSRIVKHNNKYLQTAGVFSSSQIKYYNLTTYTPDGLKKHFAHFAQRKIKIFDAFLYAFAIIKLPQKTCIYFKFHHIIADSWSLFLFEKLLMVCYSKIQLKLKPNLTYQSLNSFLNHENEYLNSIDYDRDTRFFMQKTLQIKPVFTGRGRKNIDAERLKFYFSKTESQRLNNFCRKHSTSPYIVVLSAFSVWLQKTENINTFHILTPVRNRNNHKQKNCFGMFVNTLPLEISINKNNTFLDHIKHLKQEYLLFLKHSKYPNSLVFENLTPYNNLPDIFFSFENTSVKDKKVEIEHFFADADTTALSFHLSDRDNTQRLLLETDFQKAIFNPLLINTMHKALKTIINEGIKNPSVLISEMNIFSVSYTKKMAQGICYKKAPEKCSYTLAELFNNQLINNTEADAVVFKNRRLNYKTLNGLSEKISSHLNSAKKTNKQITVAVCMPKSEKLIAVLLAVIKAGGIFFPLETDLPHARKQLMLDTIKPDILIEDKHHYLNYNGLHYLYEELLKNNISENKSIIIQGKYLAVYFTSGTTGIPNAVYICYSGFINLINAWKNFYRLKPYNSHVLQLANISFDVFMADIAKSLFNGGKLILCAKEDRLNLKRLSEIIVKEKVCLLESTPALGIPLMKYLYKKYPEIKSLRHVIMGGDACATDEFYKLVNIWGNNIHFYNSYGVTETCIETTVYRAKSTDAYNCAVAPLGYALPDRRIYILNTDLQTLPPGTKGSIYIGGTGVASSYINNPILTKKRFIKSPFTKNEILYHTGDYARLLPDGNIEFLGRNDEQIKLRGFRIEPTEIELKIKELKGVMELVVLQIKQNNNDVLHAFIVKTKKSSLNEKHIIVHLKKYFPDYMLPAQISFINKMPLTENAKIDKIQLLKFINNKIKIEKTKPKNNTEKHLHNNWCKILKIRTICTNVSIFNYGADSIQVMLFVASLEKYGILIQPQDVYSYPSISELACFIDKQNDGEINTKINYSEKTPSKKIQNKIRKINGILLTGATGFLGIHLLKELIDKNHKLICLVRVKNGISGFQRLKETWEYYHTTECPTEVEIISYDGDSTPLTEALLNHSAKFTDVIHAAALVKQWGNYNEFEKANIVLTKEIIRICKNYKKYLHHISTTSVTTLNDENNNKNPYIHTKHLAEEILFKALEKGLKASIYRTGNLSGRYTDGKFQKNIEENISYQLIKGIVLLSAVPHRFIKYSIDMTPVDLCSKVIAEQLSMAESGQIFQIAHKTKTNDKALANAFKEMGFNIKEINDKLFNKLLHASSKKKNTDTDLQIILLKHFFNTNLPPIADANHKTNFNFPELDKDYFKKILEECIRRDFFSLKNE